MWHKRKEVVVSIPISVVEAAKPAPKFCRFCGAPMQMVRTQYAFNEQTGAPIYTKMVPECSNQDTDRHLDGIKRWMLVYRGYRAG